MDIGGYGRENEKERDFTLLRGFGLPAAGIPVSLLKAAEAAVKKTPSKSEEKKKIRKRKVTSSTTLTSPLGLTGAPPVVRPTLLGG
jgi:hypothetical protein